MAKKKSTTPRDTQAGYVRYMDKNFRPYGSEWTRKGLEKYVSRVDLETILKNENVDNIPLTATKDQLVKSVMTIYEKADTKGKGRIESFVYSCRYRRDVNKNNPFLKRINEFFKFLATNQFHQIKVSPSIASECISAFSVQDISDFEMVRGEMKSAICKNKKDFERFDMLFDIWFKDTATINNEEPALAMRSMDTSIRPGNMRRNLISTLGKFSGGDTKSGGTAEKDGEGGGGDDQGKSPLNLDGENDDGEEETEGESSSSGGNKENANNDESESDSEDSEDSGEHDEDSNDPSDNDSNSQSGDKGDNEGEKGPEDKRGEDGDDEYEGDDPDKPKDSDNGGSSGDSGEDSDEDSSDGNGEGESDGEEGEENSEDSGEGEGDSDETGEDEADTDGNGSSSDNESDDSNESDNSNDDEYGDNGDGSDEGNGENSDGDGENSNDETENGEPGDEGEDGNGPEGDDGDSGSDEDNEDDYDPEDDESWEPDEPPEQPPQQEPPQNQPPQPPQPPEEVAGSPPPQQESDEQEPDVPTGDCPQCSIGTLEWEKDEKKLTITGTCPLCGYSITHPLPKRDPISQTIIDVLIEDGNILAIGQYFYSLEETLERINKVNYVNDASIDKKAYGEAKCEIHDINIWSGNGDGWSLHLNSEVTGMLEKYHKKDYKPQKYWESIATFQHEFLHIFTDLPPITGEICVEWEESKVPFLHYILLNHYNLATSPGLLKHSDHVFDRMCQKKLTAKSIGAFYPPKTFSFFDQLAGMYNLSPELFHEIVKTTVVEHMRRQELFAYVKRKYPLWRW